MLADSNNTPIARLRRAFQRRRLALYLGAGVSAASGLPTWEKLVVAMYFRALDEKQQQRNWRAYSNYLYAIAEWHLKRRPESAEIVAQKIRNFYSSDDEFMDRLRRTLYGDYLDQDTGEALPRQPADLRQGNATLDGVAALCQGVLQLGRGVRAVVTYNFDDLLETALSGTGVNLLPIWKERTPLEEKWLPIYHVHGYMPLEGDGASLNEIVFSEEQYHRAALDAYSWSSLVQLKCFTQCTGLMVGVSLTDRNMRRLLDALRRTPLPTENYALLQRPQWQPPTEAEIEKIHQQAMEFTNRFINSGVKARRPERQQAIPHLVQRVEAFDQTQHTTMLRQLGVEPIWYDDHAEVPGILQQVMI